MAEVVKIVKECQGCVEHCRVEMFGDNSILVHSGIDVYLEISGKKTI